MPSPPLAPPSPTPSWKALPSTPASRSNWPQGQFHLDELPRKVTRAYLLADPRHKPLKWIQTAGTLNVELPTKTLDPVATVLVLDTAN